MSDGVMAETSEVCEGADMTWDGQLGIGGDCVRASDWHG